MESTKKFEATLSNGKTPKNVIIEFFASSGKVCTKTAMAMYNEIEKYALMRANLHGVNAGAEAFNDAIVRNCNELGLDAEELVKTIEALKVERHEEFI